MAFLRFYRGGQQTAGRTRRRNRYIDETSQAAFANCSKGKSKKTAGFFAFLPRCGFVGIESSRTEESGSFSEQDSTTVPKFAYLRFCPCGKSCWGVPSPNPAYPLRGNKTSVKLPKIFCKYFKTPTLFLPIFELKYEGIFFQILSKTVPLHTLFFSY